MKHYMTQGTHNDGVASMSLFMRMMSITLELCRFPVAKHPVLAFSGAPGSFPVAKHNRDLQKYFKWSENIASLADSFIQAHLMNGPFVGIHLRLGSDWVKLHASRALRYC